MRQRAIRALVAATTCIAMPRAQAQVPTVEIPARPACSGCTIELAKVATVGKADDPVLMGEGTSVARGPGKTFLAASFDGTELLVFDSAGKYLRAVGRRGQGPGEFTGGVRVDGRGRGDSVYVHSRRTISVFSPGLEFGRSFPMPAGPSMSFLPLPNGTAIYGAAPARTRVAGVSLFRLLNASGDSIASFGIPADDPPETCATCATRSISVGHDLASIVVTHTNRYLIERYDLTGRTLSRVAVTGSPWMQEWTTDAPAGAALTTRPRPRIIGTVGAAGSRLWVLGQVAARNWVAPGPPEGPGVVRVGGMTAIAANSEASRVMMEKAMKNYATVVDLVDLDRRQVIASQTFDPGTYTSVADDLVQIRRMDADGVITFDIYRLQLKER